MKALTVAVLTRALGSSGADGEDVPVFLSGLLALASHT